MRSSPVLCSGLMMQCSAAWSVAGPRRTVWTRSATTRATFDRGEHVLRDRPEARPKVPDPARSGPADIGTQPQSQYFCDRSTRKWVQLVERRCTTPAVQDLQKWNDLFRPACDRHDFSYGVFGVGGDVAVPTETQRRRIDDQFLRDMNGICVANYTWVRRAECRLLGACQSGRASGLLRVTEAGDTDRLRSFIVSHGGVARLKGLDNIGAGRRLRPQFPGGGPTAGDTVGRVVASRWWWSGWGCAGGGVQPVQRDGDEPMDGGA